MISHSASGLAVDPTGLINVGSESMRHQVMSSPADFYRIHRSQIDIAFYFEIKVRQTFARILNHLESIGELENTLVIVTSDNGMPFPQRAESLRIAFTCLWQCLGLKLSGGQENHHC